jgi:hypothetical protein
MVKMVPCAVTDWRRWRRMQLLTGAVNDWCRGGKAQGQKQIADGATFRPKVSATIVFKYAIPDNRWGEGKIKT